MAHKFDGVDLFLFDPHVSIDSSDSDLRRLVDRIRARQISGWLPGRAGLAADRRRIRDGDRRANGSSFITQVRKACEIGKKLRDLGIRTIMASSASIPPRARRSGPRILQANTKRIADTFREACTSPKASASGSRPKEKSAGAACTVGSGSRAARDGRPTEDDRLSGRHGAHAAFHARLQRARGSSTAGMTSIGPAGKRSTRR